MADACGRLMAALPAVFRANDDGGLHALLAACERILLASGDADAPALAEEIDALSRLIAPLGVTRTAPWMTAGGATCLQPETRPPAPERFMPWLAQWVAFTPYRYFSADELRRIVAGIVPLYGLRGTREYLMQLLGLCFGTLGKWSIDENPRVGLTVGHARVGVDTVLAVPEPFHFRIEGQMHDGAPGAQRDLEERVRAVIDFARPAHTTYELILAGHRTRPIDA